MGIATVTAFFLLTLYPQSYANIHSIQSSRAQLKPPSRDSHRPGYRGQVFNPYQCAPLPCPLVGMVIVARDASLCEELDAVQLYAGTHHPRHILGKGLDRRGRSRSCRHVLAHSINRQHNRVAGSRRLRLPSRNALGPRLGYPCRPDAYAGGRR